MPAEGWEAGRGVSSSSDLICNYVRQEAGGPPKLKSLLGRKFANNGGGDISSVLAGVSCVTTLCCDLISL